MQYHIHCICSILYSKRSEEHTSELQSRENLVCRLLLEKKKAPACRPGRPGGFESGKIAPGCQGSGHSARLLRSPYVVPAPPPSGADPSQIPDPPPSVRV